ncbi:hypothetical protein ACTWQA_47150 [Nonomuraea sp. 10N515B]
MVGRSSRTRPGNRRKEGPRPYRQEKPLSNFHDLAANDATTALIINVITAVGQFQRDCRTS